LKVIAILFGIILLFPIGISYGDTDVSGRYFCNPENMFIEKDNYMGKIFNYNLTLEYFKVRHSNASIEELNDYMLTQSRHIKEIGESAKCLTENNVDPETVAKLSEEVKEVLMYDPEILVDIAPNFVEYVEVPEFYEITMMVLASGIIGIVVMSRKFVNLENS